MTAAVVSPVLTWTCLFPSDVSYHCHGVDDTPADWVRELISAPPGDRRPVLVMSDRAATDLPDMSDYCGLAAVNCRGLSDQHLATAGFNHIRRFAVLPNLARPRWFIPLDSAAVSAAGFCLNRPSKRMAHAVHLGARTIARLGARVWYRDQICVAQKDNPPIERVLQPLFPDRSIRVALCSGSPPPARNRKITLAVIDGATGEVVAFAKLPGPTAESGRSVRNEAAILAKLPSMRAPALLWSGPVGATFMAVMTPVDGRTVSAERTPAHDRFLRSLQHETVKPALKTGFAVSLYARAPLLAGREDIHRALDELRPALSAMMVRPTIVHGDFAPWNLRKRGGEIFAFDWEYATLDGLPLIDEIHHLLAVGYLLRNWSAAQATNRLTSHASSTAGRAKLSFDDIRVLQKCYLIDYLLRLFNEGYGDDYPRVAWCREILSRLAGESAKGGSQ